MAASTGIFSFQFTSLVSSYSFLSPFRFSKCSGFTANVALGFFSFLGGYVGAYSCMLFLYITAYNLSRNLFIIVSYLQQLLHMPIIVKPISANLTKDADGFGKADPYCLIWIGQEKQRTQTCKGAGKHPQWTDTLQFQSTDQLLRVQVWDADTFSDDQIGEGTVNLNQLFSNPGRTENEYVDLVYKGKSAGRLLLSLEYQGPPMGGNQQWGGQQQQSGWGNQGNQGSNWGGNQGPNQGWGNQQGPNQGWGNQQGPNQGWGNQQGPNQGWGNQGPNQGWGNQQGPNQGWGNQQGPNQGWGNQQGPNQGWGNNQGPNQGWGNNQGW